MPAAKIRHRSASIGGRVRRAVVGSFFNHLAPGSLRYRTDRPPTTLLRPELLRQAQSTAAPAFAPCPGCHTSSCPEGAIAAQSLWTQVITVDPSDPAGTRAFVICCGDLCAPGVCPWWVCSIESSAYPRGSPCRWGCARAATRRTSTGFHNNQQRPTCPPAHLGPQYRRRGDERRRLQIRRMK